MSISAIALKLLHLADRQSRPIEAALCREASALIEKLYGDCDAKDEQIKRMQANLVQPATAD